MPPRRISSGTTPWYKYFATPLLWGYGVFILAFNAPLAADIRDLQDAALILAALLIAALVVALPLRYWLPLADVVYLDGNELVVVQRRNGASIPLADVASVAALWIRNPENIVVKLRSRTEVGDQFVFAPRTRWFPYGRHPVLDELEKRIEWAKEDRDLEAAVQVSDR